MYPSNCSFNIISGNFVKILPNLNCYGSLGRFSKCQANLLGWGCVWAPQVGKLWNQVFPWRLSTSSSSSSSKTIKTNNITIVNITHIYYSSSWSSKSWKSYKFLIISFVMGTHEGSRAPIVPMISRGKGRQKWPRQKVGNISQGSPRGDQTACPLVGSGILYIKKILKTSHFVWPWTSRDFARFANADSELGNHHFLGPPLEKNKVNKNTSRICRFHFVQPGESILVKFHRFEKGWIFGVGYQQKT